MDKYIVVVTLCNNEDVAHRIINGVLRNHLAAGSQMNKVHSKYYWKSGLEECDEYKIEFRTKLSLFDDIKKEIEKYHDYETAEITSYEILSANKEIIEWIENNTK